MERSEGLFLAFKLMCRLLGKYFAKLNTRLIEHIDIPDTALNGNTVSGQRDRLDQSSGRQTDGEQRAA